MTQKKSRTPCRFLKCDRGLAAVEFALIAPLMITTYLGASELCNLLLTYRKVTNVTAATTDLVAQALTISNSDMTDIFSASTAIMEPFDLSSLKIVVTSAVADADGDVTVAWSNGYNAVAHAQGAAFTLPNGIIDPGGSVIVTEVNYNYISPIGQFWTNGFSVHDTFYERPRRVTQIAWNS